MGTIDEKVKKVFELPSSDLFVAVKPLYFASKVVGMAPFTYVKVQVSATGTIRFKYCVLSCVYTALLFTALFVWFLLHMVQTIKTESRHDFYAYIVEKVMVKCLIYTTALTSIGFSLTRNQYKMQNIFLKLEEIDAILLNTSKAMYKNIRYCTIVELTGVFVLLLALCCYDVISKHHPIIMVEYLLLLIITIMNMQFINWVLLLKHLFGLLNKQLVAGFGVSEDSVLGWTQLHRQGSAPVTVLPCEARIPTIQAADSLRTHRRAYMMLYQVATLINDTYGFPLLQQFTLILVEVSWSVFVLLSNTFQDGAQLKCNELVTLGLLLAIDIGHLLGPALGCQGAAVEASRTAHLIHQLQLLAPPSPDASEQLQLFSQQLMHSKLHFSACGVVPINASLLSSVALVASIHVIILLQSVIIKTGNDLAVESTTASRS